MSHASWTAGAGQRAPTFSPFLPFCNRTHLPSTHFWMLQGPRCWVCQRGPRPQVTLGWGSIHLHPQGLPLAGHPFQALARPRTLCGGRAPSGRGCTPALPGEVCKHSCSRAREPLEVRPQGYTTRGRGQEGTDRGRRLPGQQLRRLGDLPPPADAPTPLRLAQSAPPHAPKSPGEQRETGSLHTLQEGHARPPGRSREGGGSANLNGVRRPKLSRAAFHGASGLVG